MRLQKYFLVTETAVHPVLIKYVLKLEEFCIYQSYLFLCWHCHQTTSLYLVPSSLEFS